MMTSVKKRIPFLKPTNFRLQLFKITRKTWIHPPKLRLNRKSLNLLITSKTFSLERPFLQIKITKRMPGNPHHHRHHLGKIRRSLQITLASPPQNPKGFATAILPFPPPSSPINAPTVPSSPSFLKYSILQPTTGHLNKLASSTGPF